MSDLNTLTVTLNLVELLECLSYKQLFHYFHVPTSIAQSIAEVDKDKLLCYVESNNDETSIIWYPIRSWIEECKRRSWIEQMIKEQEIKDAIRKRRAEEDKLTGKDPEDIKSKLTKKLLEATLAGNEEEANRIAQTLIEINKAGI